MPYALKFRMERDLFWINLLGIVLIIIIGLFPTSLVRMLIGVPFILFFPGYALVCALFPKKLDLDGIERVALSIGLSIAVVPLIGLVLNYTPFGIRLYPVLVSLFLFSFLMSIATFYRRRKISIVERFVPSFSTSVPKWGEMNGSDRVLSVGLMASVLVSGALISYFVYAPRTEEGFTEFYVLGPTGKVEGYPTNLTLGEEGRVILGIVNHEYEKVNYSIVIRFDNQTLGTIEDIGLDNEENWVQNYTFAPQKAGENIKLEFLLFINNDVNVYRSLHLWIKVSKP